MSPVSLKDFVRTGCFGPIQLGISRDNLRMIFGQPECWGGPDAKSMDTATIWKFGDIEFYFDANVLYQIFWDNFTGADSTTIGGEQMLIDPWIIRDFMDHRQLENELKQASIPYAVQRDKIFTEMLNITTDSGVCFRFQIELEFPEIERLGLHCVFIRKD